MKKRFIKNLSIEEAEQFFIEAGLEKYRARQLYTWLYDKNISSFDEMTNYSKSLRSSLDENFSVSSLELSDRRISSIDLTEKFLFKTHDGNFVESVLIKNDMTEDGRLTLCISSQVGCAMGCTFCHTGKLGFTRNLEVAEILDQVSIVRKVTGLINNNIVFMGMGEPLLNYDNVMKAASIMNYSFGFHISVRKITISTCGILPSIERFIDEKQPYNLAISLNDTVSEKRAKVMPVEKKYPVNNIAELLSKKLPVSHNRLTIEYVMRKDNISRDDALRLKKMFRYSHIKLNLIPLNGNEGNNEAPTNEDIEAFMKNLEIMNIPITVRKSLGQDIEGACGQLSGEAYYRRNLNENTGTVN